MPPIVRGLIFMAIGAGLQAILWFALVAKLFHLSAGTVMTPGLIGALAAGVFGFITGIVGIYALRPLSIWVFILDVTWSALNTVTGLIFLIYCAIKGTFETPTETTQDRGAIHFTDAALPGAQATTIGTVMGGDWLIHETIHLQQARIFGPYYWPMYLVPYLLNMLARFLTIRFSNPHWEAYGRVVMEDWAFNAAPRSKTSIEVGPWILWFFLALINGFGLLVAVAHIPVVGAIPALIGLTVIPWWIGLIILLLYALIRSFIAQADDTPAPVPAPAPAPEPAPEPEPDFH